jgi:hypothetical protein
MLSEDVDVEPDREVQFWSPGFWWLSRLSAPLVLGLLSPRTRDKHHLATAPFGQSDAGQELASDASAAAIRSFGTG